MRGHRRADRGGPYEGFEMAEQMNAVAEVIEPRPEDDAVCQRLQRAWEPSSRALEPLFDQLAAFGDNT